MISKGTKRSRVTDSASRTVSTQPATGSLVSFDQQLLEELENQIAHRSGFGLDCEQLQQVRSCIFDALCVVNRKRGR